MSLHIAHNRDGMLAHFHASRANERVMLSMDRISRGTRINRSQDDPSGMGISERMRIQLRGLQQVRRNGNDGIALLQIVDGALGEVHSILQRARDLYLQFNSGSIDANGKNAIAKELAALSNEIGRIASATSFNNQKVLGSGLTRVTLQVGTRVDDVIDFSMVTLVGTINALVNPNDFFMLPFFNPDMDSIDDSIERVSQARARFGALQNRLEHAMAATTAYEENLLSTESRVRDVDMARELTELTKSQLLTQKAISMIGQSQQNARSVFDLLRS